jgi:ribosomal protein L28
MSIFYTTNKDKITGVRISKQVLRLIKKNSKFKTVQSILDAKVLEIISEIEKNGLQVEEKKE